MNRALPVCGTVPAPSRGGRQRILLDEQHSSMDGPKVLTLDEAARLVRCSKAHMANVVNGKVAGVPPLKCMTIGRRKLIRSKTLEQWMEAVEAGEHVR